MMMMLCYHWNVAASVITKAVAHRELRLKYNDNRWDDNGVIMWLAVPLTGWEVIERGEYMQLYIYSFED